MVKNRLFTVLAVLGIMNFRIEAQQLPNAQQSMKILLPTLVSTVPNRSPIAKHSSGSSRPILVSNGFEIIPPQDSPSLGTLKIINGITKDAAVKLVDNSSKKTRRFVYVQANHEALLKKISPCGCSIRFTLGKNWNQGKRSFSQNPSFFKFNNRLDFKETKTAAGVQWMNYTITLHSVPTGNVKTAPISERDF